MKGETVKKGRAARVSSSHLTPSAQRKKKAVTGGGGPGKGDRVAGGGRTLENLTAAISEAKANDTVRRKEDDAPLQGSGGRQTGRGSSSADVAVDGPPFASLGLPPAVASRLAAVGLLHATAIQASAIPLLCEGRDAAIQSYTGSGKTLAYLIPILIAVGPDEWQQQQQQQQQTPKSFQLTEGNGINPQQGRGQKGRTARGGGGGGGGGGVKAVVVAPSQELAMQIVREAQRLLGPIHKECVQQLIGGANPRRQEEALKRNKPALVVGTPGRLAEMSRSGGLHSHGCRFLVLDESDALLSHKFKKDMLRLLDHVGRRRQSSTPPGSSSSSGSGRAERQTVLVSATMSGAVVDAASHWCHEPLLIQANKLPAPIAPPPHLATALFSGKESGALNSPHMFVVKGEAEDEEEEEIGGQPTVVEAPEVFSPPAIAASLSPNVKHYYAVVDHRHKVDELRRLLNATGAASAMVFMNFPRRLVDVQHKLEARGIAAATLHGGMDKMARANVLSAFRSGKVRVLVLSDVGARGLDVVECDLVVNLELPTSAPHYVHRAGRTGRLGRPGTVVSVCEASEAFVMRKIERNLGGDAKIVKAETVAGELRICE